MAHIQRMRQHHMKQESGRVDVENRYKYLYDAEYSPENYKRKQNLLGANRASLNVHNMKPSEHQIQYEQNKYQPSAAALQQYRLHDRQ